MRPDRITLLKDALEGLYLKYNRREFVHPDPLEFLYRYDDPLEREIVGLVSASLAYGRVKQILNSVSFVLERMPSPARFLRNTGRDGLFRTFSDFRHRFATGANLSALLSGVKGVIEKHGSLYHCFLDGMDNHAETVIPALGAFVEALSTGAGGEPGHLLPHPARGSACKRLLLFLRWMVRSDAVDPGGWDEVPASRLIVPLDTHMHRICRRLGLTERGSADMRTAVEITQAFRNICRDDPVRYDFVLTRLGIRAEMDPDEFIRNNRLPDAEEKRTR